MYITLITVLIFVVAEVEVLYEVKVSDELRQMALKLQLPPNFYSYLDAPPCPGCPGCEPDSEVFISTIVVLD